MNTEYKIIADLDKIVDAYSESVEVASGLTHNLKETIRTIEFYDNSTYLSGNKDELGREKPFFNIGSYRVTTAKVGTDLDVKDLRFEADTLKYSTQAMIINRELFQFLKEINYSESLNEQGYTRAKYGGVIVKKVKDEDGINIEVVDWTNVEVDPSDILGGAVIETHYMNLADFSMMDYDNKEEVLDQCKKQFKGKPAKVEIKEITGTFPTNYEPGNEDEDQYTYKTYCFYIAIVGNKKFGLYHETLKSIDEKYKYLAWQRIPKRGLGRGVWEEGFESQSWTNDSMIMMRNAMDLSGKVVLSTNSKKVSGNVLTSVKSGHIFELEDGKSISSINLSPSALPQIENMINLWDSQYNRASSTYDANTGEAPTAGTPYSQTALLNQVANSPFEYRREEMGIFQTEILNEWILPELKKRIVKEHNLVADYDDAELDLIDEVVANYEGKNKAIEALLSPFAQPVTPEQDAQFRESVKTSLRKNGSKREIKIPEGFLDVEGHITANVTGELKNKQAILQSLDSILKTIISTFNPQTGTYSALEDPVLSKLFGTIVEMAGVPISFGQLKSSKPTPSAQAAQATQAAQGVEELTTV
jgi:hypothetical protein